MIASLPQKDGIKEDTMPVKVKVKPPEMDFAEKFENYKKAISADKQLSKDAILSRMLDDFQRMAVINDNLWEDIEKNGYWLIDAKGNNIINPAIAAYNKNHATLLKTASVIEEKTKTLVLSGSAKAW